MAARPRLTLELGEFPFHRPKVRARTGGLYHPILHMHPSDMRHLNLACGGLACVTAAVAAQRARSPQKKKTAAVANGPAVVAIAWPQAGCRQGQARLSRLLQRCLVHGQPFEYDNGLTHVTVGPAAATDSILPPSVSTQSVLLYNKRKRTSFLYTGYRLSPVASREPAMQSEAVLLYGILGSPGCEDMVVVDVRKLKSQFC